MKDLGQTYAKRFEKKFIADKTKVKAYIENKAQYLSSKFDKDHFESSSNFTIINNTYFDDENLSSYIDSVEKKKKRLKIRARTYAENGIQADDVFLEIKTKEDGITSKSRIMLKKKWYNDFVFKGIVNLDLIIELNNKTDRAEVIQTLEQLSEFIHDKNYKPMLINSYKRTAYKFKKDHKLRLTIDSNLKYELIGQANSPKTLYTKSITNNDVIIEAKYKNPELYNVEMADLKKDILGPSQGFSKYCFCITKAFTAPSIGEGQILNNQNLLSEEIIKRASLKESIHTHRI